MPAISTFEFSKQMVPRVMVWTCVLTAALLTSAGPVEAAARVPTHVACVGDSITAGVGASSGNTNYPADLQGLFGSSVQVKNFGHSGATMLSVGDLPYQQQSEYSGATSFVSGAGSSATVDVIIMLGTNDSKPYNWTVGTSTRAAQFKTDCAAMVDHFAQLSTHPLVYLALPPHAYTNSYQISGTIIHDQIVPIIQQVAAEKGIPVIDVDAPTTGHAELFPDGVHPNDAGYKLLAQVMHDGLLASIGGAADSGVGGNGGAGGSGAGGNGGTGAGGTMVASGGSGGASPAGGTGGASSGSGDAGIASNGGARATGGALSSGGTVASGGGSGSGGVSGTGGSTPGTGGVFSAGGLNNSGGAWASGGSSAVGGSTHAGTGGSGTAATTGNSNGCSCALAASAERGGATRVMLLILGAAVFMRRRRISSDGCRPNAAGYKFMANPNSWPISVCCDRKSVAEVGRHLKGTSHESEQRK